MVKANDNANADLANVLDEKQLPVSRDLKNLFNYYVYKVQNARMGRLKVGLLQQN